MAVSYYKSNVNNIPPVPVTSRFVAPWDTSGWYYMSTDLNIGSKIYSNSDVTVGYLDEKYRGADFVVTFNSFADGFDDKQEVDFFAERDITVYVCYDKNCVPEYANELFATGDIMRSSDGTEYSIYSKKYSAGDHVNIPGFSGEGNHFSVFALADDYKECEGALPKSIVADNIPAPYQKREYRNYITDVFNADKISSEYEVFGNVEIKRNEYEKRDGFVSLTGNAKIERIFDGSDRIVASAKISSSESAVSSFALANRDGKALVEVGFAPDGIFCGEKKAAENNNKDISLRIVFDGEKGKAEIYINCRKAITVDANKGNVGKVSFLSNGGVATLDNLVVSDDTEMFAVNDDFASGTGDFSAKTENAVVELVKYPFEDSHAISVKSNDGEFASYSYGFSPISGISSVEALLMANSDEFSYAPELTDKNRNPAVRIALYKNNLYASNGDEYVRIFGGDCDFMYYPCQNAMNIKVISDTENGTYDLMVDGAYRARGFKFINPVKEISNAVFSASKSGLTLMRIRVYDDADLCRNVLPNAPIFDVTKAPYNASADGKTLATAAIQKAVDDAAFTGGTVLLPYGTFLSGEIFLASDMTLFVGRDATISGTNDHAQYPLMEPGTSLCAVRQLGRALVYGENVSNVRITGGGMLDGNGTYRFKMNDPLSDKRKEDCRPDLCYITYSKDILIESINFKSPGFWTVVPLSSKNIIMRYLNLDCLNTPNRDGIDPVDCHDMTIYSCNIMAGDDGLCFKSSDPYGCENIDAYDLMIQSLASGIKFGTDTYYSLKNVRVSDCFVKNVNRCGVSLESVDGAEVENVVFERISMTDVGAPAYITVGDRKRCPRGGAEPRLGSIKNVTFSELRFEHAYPFSHTKSIREVMAIGQYDHARIEDVKFKDCYFVLAGGYSEIPGEPRTIDNRYPEYDRHGASSGHAFTVKYAKNFTVENCKIVLENPDARPEIAYYNYETYLSHSER